ncbi:metallophosphoesterase family protein [Microbacterium sp. No. 7]|uniref:metallophosphoesterase family protein n=1 Tax=Microbacterium sp. No. 7 TaxID=1714373 RepID=UPI0006CFEF7D|nr:metallophosphoesterase [Microbacterium sp. No. 7]ALJ22122.1 phosphoesterase [Microbacterium sp. No. 7]
MSRATGRLTILHVSDVHATDGELLYGAVDGFARLRAVSEYVAHAGITPEAIVVTGDLAQRGHPGVYPRLAAALAALERETGVPVLTVIGNHDDPAAACTLPGHAPDAPAPPADTHAAPARAGHAPAPPVPSPGIPVDRMPGNPHARIVRVDGLRIALLDSSSGELGGAQRAWLADRLREPHGDGTIVALHHPPLGSPLPTLAKAGLRDADALLDIARNADVRAILAGHFHHPLSAVLHGVPVFVGPSLAYHQVMDAGPDRVSGHDHAMFSLVHLVPHGVTATSVGLEHPAPLFTSPAPSLSATSPSATPEHTHS